MSYNIRRSNGINYIRIVNGVPYLYNGIPGSGAVSYTVCQTGAITNDYTITFVDDAHPLYVVGTGNIGGMWGPDIYYYNQHMPEGFPSCANILFDVDTPFVARGTFKGQSITEDPFFVYPTGVTTSSPVGCELPIPILNIVQIARPSGGLESDNTSTAIGTISQLEFKNAIVSGIEVVWGNGFWDRMSASSNQLWIIRESGLSMGSNVIQSGVDLFKSYLDSQSVNYTEHMPSCNDTERYLGWISDCIMYSGENVSCTGTFQIPDITDVQCSGDGPGDKLVTGSFDGYTTTSGTYLETGNVIVKIAPVFDNTTTCYSSIWSNLISPGNDVVDYTEYYTTDRLDIEYWYHANFTYVNGIPKTRINAACYNTSGYYVTAEFQGNVPLDKYGVPNGTVDLEEIISIDTTYANGYDCVPRFPNIVFTSHVPSSWTAASGTDCTVYNPS